MDALREALSGIDTVIDNLSAHRRQLRRRADSLNEPRDATSRAALNRQLAVVDEGTEAIEQAYRRILAASQGK